MTACSIGQILEELSLDLELAVIKLKAGEIIAFPTETFFGLGVDPSNEVAVDKLLKIKQRHLNEGISLIVSSSEVINALPIKEQFREKRIALQDRFWPGALTLIIDLEQSNLPFSKKLLAADGSIAIRISSSEVATKLSSAIGGFITATSANPHSQAPAKNSIEAAKYFPDIFVLDGKTDSLEPSTIVDTRTIPFSVLRQGAISLEKIRPYL